MEEGDELDLAVDEIVSMEPEGLHLLAEARVSLGGEDEDWALAVLHKGECGSGSLGACDGCDKKRAGQSGEMEKRRSV